MKISFKVADTDSVHPHHSEVWVRVLTHDPLGPGDWPKALEQARKDPDYDEAFDGVEVGLQPCAFYVDLWDDDDPDYDDYGFEQWFVLPKVSYAGRASA